MAGAANIIDVTEATFEFEVIQRSHEIPVVVDFWAPWCGPCHMLAPILEKLASTPAYDFVLAKLNVDDNGTISMRYGVQGIPAVKAFMDGQIVAEFVGAQPEPKVREFIEQLIPNEADLAFRDANSLLATRHWAEAQEAYEQLLDEYPDYLDAKLNLARALLAQARGCEAQPYLEESRQGPKILQAERLLPLARYLCRVETAASTALSTGVDDDLDLEPIEIQYRQSARLLQRNNLEAALDGLLDVLRQDKRYRKGEPKDVMLGIFELLGDGDSLTQTYRSELGRVLF